MLADDLGLAFDFENGGNAASCEIGDDDEAFFADPNGDGLQVEFFGGLVILEQTGKLINEDHLIFLFYYIRFISRDCQMSLKLQSACNPNISQ